MKVTIDLTEQEINDAIKEINFHFEECESPTHSRWSLDSDNYSEKKRIYKRKPYYSGTLTFSQSA